MPEPQANLWTELFRTEPGQANSVLREMRLLRKHGRPLLLLPTSGPAAAAALSLYPAQTNRARTMRKLFGCALRFGLPVGIERVSVQFSTQDSFVKFLSSVTGNPEITLPELGILAGNPASENQRFILLLFDKDRKPIAVVKCGVSPQAKELVTKEAAFLAAASGKLPGIPRLGGKFDSSRLQAFATDYFAGDPPMQEEQLAFPSLLGSWVDS